MIIAAELKIEHSFAICIVSSTVAGDENVAYLSGNAFHSTSIRSVCKQLQQ